MILLQKALAEAGIPVSGVNANGTDKSKWRIDFSTEATTEQKAQAADIVASFDAVKTLHNAQIDADIAAVYEEAPPSPRAFTELAWALCSIVDIQNEQITALVNVIREIGGPAYADFDVPRRIPDLKRNKGMVTVKSQIDRTKALRAQKQ